MNPSNQAARRFGRRLRHSMLALAVVATASGAGLFMARPLPTEAEVATLPGGTLNADRLQAMQAVVELESNATMTETLPEAGTAPSLRKPSQRSRQTLAMPYFSFAARS